MSQPKKKLSLKPSINKINPAASQWVEGKKLNTDTQKSVVTEKQESINTGTQKSRQKEYKRITLDVSPELHYKLKKHTLETGEPMSELLRRLAEDFLTQQNL